MSSTSDPSPATNASEPVPPQEWKPEPRQWTWKDLFTAPMLAFKPKCMLISAITLVALGAWAWLFDRFAWDLHAESGLRLWFYLAAGVWIGVGSVIFSLGASLVAVFMRADLLDDEFLSLREALALFKSRLAPALLVPLFLIALVVGVNLFLVYVPELICSIPYAGGTLYAIFYPLAFFLALFAVLLLIAVCLSIFVFPGIIAIRKHGWFDNVVDTIEAVGTKPHVLIGSLLLSVIMISVAFSIGKTAMGYLQIPSKSDGQLLPGQELSQVETRADEVQYLLYNHVDVLPQLSKLWQVVDPGASRMQAVPMPIGYGNPYANHFQSMDDWNSMFATANERLNSPINRLYAVPGYTTYGTGVITGIWKTLILAVLLGYCMNLLVGGGMLTYLLVREDDYWDDEDLEDLDKLAKELEEEAKRDESSAPASQSAAPAPAPAAPSTPPPPGA
jgi:hypothetical protein